MGRFVSAYSLPAAIMAQAVVSTFLWSPGDAAAEDKFKLNIPGLRGDITGGVPIQRKRIDDFIAQTASYKGFDETVAGLNDDVQSGIVYYAGTLSSGPDAHSEFISILADRRIAKLYGYLADMPANVAADRISEVFTAKLKIHNDDFGRMAHAYLTDTELEKRTPISRNYHALGGVAFLCTQFCDRENCLMQFDTWEETMRVHLDRLQADEELWRKFRISPNALQAAPESILLLNLYLQLLDRDDCVPASGLLEAIGLPVPAIRIDKTDWSAWNAHTNAFDFTHVHRGVPTDKANVLKQIRFARSWGYIFKEDRRDEILAKMRHLIKSCAGAIQNEESDKP